MLKTSLIMDNCMIALFSKFSQIFGKMTFWENSGSEFGTNWENPPERFKMPAFFHSDFFFRFGAL
jgi:hypothetical protein